MTTEEINLFIKNYTQDYKLKTAIMLNGPWGSGKSYYIENNLTPFLKKECGYNVVKVSVYGMKDLAELTKQIYYEIRLKKLKKKKEILSGGKIIVKGLLSGVSSFFNVHLKIDDKDLQQLYSSIDLNNKLLVIEDLERTDINLVKLLGFINNLTEQDNAKVLIIANENEILKQTVVFNNETKKFEQHFSENAENYLHIKEKTISDTLYFSLDYNNAILNIVGSFKCPMLIRQFSDYDFKKLIFEKIKSSQHENLRTVIFTFQKFVDISKYLPLDIADEIVMDIIAHLFDICIELKKGKLDKTDLDIISNINEKYKSTEYYFIAQYILYQILNKESINNDLKNIEDALKIKKENSFDPDIEKLQNFICYDDNEVLKSIKSIELKLENNDLSYFNYNTLASYIIFLSSYLEFDSNKIKKLMLENLSKCKNPEIIKFGFLVGIQQVNDIKEKEYIEFKNKMVTAVNETKDINIGFELNNCINDSKQFREFCYKNSERFINEHKFFIYLDVQNFVDKINNSSPNDITMFRYSMGAVYRFSNIADYFQNDIPKLVDCIEKLKMLDFKSYSEIKKLVLSWFINDLEKYTKNLGYDINK